MITWIAAVAVFGTVMAGTPGPNNVLLAASGLRFGFARSLPFVAGIQAGLVVLIVLVDLGLGQVVDRWPVVIGVLRVLGSAYLLWLAYQLWTASSMGAGPAVLRPFGFVRGTGFQFANPKAWIMALTFVSGLLASAPIAGVWARVVGIGVFVVVCVASCLVWLLFGAALRRQLADPARLRLVNRILAVASAATAVLFWT
jgi:threonine/homoserine/homoserine lactone efflux protein